MEKEEIILDGSEEKKDTAVSKCPSCGANLTFNPETQKLYCDHCGTEVAFESHSTEELAFENLLKDNNTWRDDTHVFVCSNCGARQILSKDEIAKECAFCGTTNVVETDELSGLKPNAVVPFKITKQTAAEKAKTWAKKKFFAPRSFKKSLVAEEIAGTYNPAFTFDTDTVSMYQGRLGRYVYRTRRVNGKTVTERKTEYFSISGNYSVFFDDILIQASHSIQQKTVDKLQPFKTNEANDYKKEFMHGFSANQYTKDGTQCWEEARQVINKRVRSGILSKYTYDFVDYLHIKTDCNNITYKYLLLPVYVGHFNFRQKLYNFFVNGSSGKVAGKTPVSPLRVAIVTLLGIGLVVGAAIGIYLGLFA